MPLILFDVGNGGKLRRMIAFEHLSRHRCDAHNHPHNAHLRQRRPRRLRDAVQPLSMKSAVV